EAVRRAGHADGEALFEAILASRSGVTVAVDEYADAWRYVSTSDGLIAVAVPALLDDLRQLPAARPGWTTARFPFVLSAGQRRSSTANTIVRDPQWRTSDVEGALRMSPSDAASLAVVSGDRVRVRTAGGLAEAVVEVDDRMQP
nr:molybdopterin dinucleotide binding domain-containing protein [Micromonospora sp. DSM 115978]